MLHLCVTLAELVPGNGSWYQGTGVGTRERELVPGTGVGTRICMSHQHFSRVTLNQ